MNRYRVSGQRPESAQQLTSLLRAWARAWDVLTGRHRGRASRSALQCATADCRQPARLGSLCTACWRQQALAELASSPSCRRCGHPAVIRYPQVCWGCMRSFLATNALRRWNGAAPLSGDEYLSLAGKGRMSREPARLLRSWRTGPNAALPPEYRRGEAYHA